MIIKGFGLILDVFVYVCKDMEGREERKEGNERNQHKENVENIDIEELATRNLVWPCCLILHYVISCLYKSNIIQ